MRLPVRLHVQHFVLLCDVCDALQPKNATLCNVYKIHKIVQHIDDERNVQEKTHIIVHAIWINMAWRNAGDVSIKDSRHSGHDDACV